MRFQDIQKVLFIRLRSLGDCVLMTPCLEALKTRWPHLRLDVLVERPFMAVYQGNPHVGRLLVLERGRSGLQTAWRRLLTGLRLRREGYQLVLNYHGGSTSLFLMRLCKSPERAGYAHYRSPAAYTCLLDGPERYFGGGPMHTVQYQLALLARLGLELPDPPPPPSFPVPAEAARTVRSRLAAMGRSGAGFGLVPPTAPLAPQQWPPVAFARFIDQVRRETGAPVILSCGPGERPVLEAIGQALEQPAPGFSDLTLPELGALIQGAAVFVGCDSGPAHIAAALKKKVCVVFGSSNHQAWGPWETEHRLVRLPFGCSPCPGYDCQAYGHPRCIEEIEPAAVYAAFRQLFD